MQVQLKMRSIFDKNLLENNVKARKKNGKNKFFGWYRRDRRHDLGMTIRYYRYEQLLSIRNLALPIVGFHFLYHLAFVCLPTKEYGLFAATTFWSDR